MKKILSIILALALLAGCAAALAETAAETAGCLIPATATARFDAALEELLPGEAAQYRLSADTGFMNLNYNSQIPAVTFSFEFPEGTEKSETTQASMMSFMMFGEMPEDTEKAILACFIRTITEDYADDAGTVQRIEDWFAAEKEPNAVFVLPACTITVVGEGPGFRMYNIERAVADGEAVTVVLPSYLTPAVFTAEFNEMMDALADRYADELGEDGVRLVKSLHLTVKDDQGMIVAYGTSGWEIEASFYYPDGMQTSDDEPAMIMNLIISDSVPLNAAKLAVYSFKMILAYEYRDDESIVDELTDWFATADDPSDICILPDGKYSLNTVVVDSNVHYAILPEGHNDWEIMRKDWTDGN